MLHSLNTVSVHMALMVPFMVMISHAHGVWNSTRETTFCFPSHLRFPPLAASCSTHLLASQARWLPYIALIRIILYHSSIKPSPQTLRASNAALIAAAKAHGVVSRLGWLGSEVVEMLRAITLCSEEAIIVLFPSDQS